MDIDIRTEEEKSELDHYKQQVLAELDASLGFIPKSREKDEEDEEAKGNVMSQDSHSSSEYEEYLDNRESQMQDTEICKPFAKHKYNRGNENNEGHQKRSKFTEIDYTESHSEASYQFYGQTNRGDERVKEVPKETEFIGTKEERDESTNELDQYKQQVMAELDASLGFKRKSSSSVQEENEAKEKSTSYSSQSHKEYGEYKDNREKEMQATGFCERFGTHKNNKYKLHSGNENNNSYQKRSKLAKVDDTSSHLQASRGVYEGAEVGDVQVKEVPKETETVHFRELMKYNFESPVEAIDFRKCLEEREENYTKGCKWSPDGSCLLVGSADNRLRLFNLPNPVASGYCQDDSWKTDREQYNFAAVKVHERAHIYDYAWYPHMRSDRPQSCCFAVTCRDQPVHLWDAWNGNLVCSYQSYNHLDQLVAALGVGFSLDGSLLVCSFKKALRIFHTSRPGRICDTIDAKGQPGILSCMAFNPQLPNIFAAGSYLGSVGLYNTRRNNLFCRLEGCGGGVTHIAFSPCGTKLFTGTRKDTEILCWDVRQLGTILHSMKRDSNTTQRIYFDLEPQLGRFLVSGNTKGEVLKWDLDQQGIIQPGDDVPVLKPSASFLAHRDCTNGISMHPYSPILATSSGQRHFPEPVESSDSDSSCEESVSKPLFSRENIIEENTVKLWWVGK